MHLTHSKIILWVVGNYPDKSFVTSEKVTIMKLFVRASILSLAVAGIVAGFAPSHSAKAQAAALSHQVVSSAMPAPMCGAHTCGIGN
jgi:hypothetical protein